jgi:hypothetical protein
MTIVEFVRWSATDEYLNDFHSRVKPTISYVQNAEGYQPRWYSLLTLTTAGINIKRLLWSGGRGSDDNLDGFLYNVSMNLLIECNLT